MVNIVTSHQGGPGFQSHHGYSSRPRKVIVESVLLPHNVHCVTYYGSHFEKTRLSLKVVEPMNNNNSLKRKRIACSRVTK